MEINMSMHLVGPYMTTTQYNRKKKQSKSKKLQQAQAEHEKWLKKMGVRKPTGDFRYAMPNYTSNSGNSVPTSDKIDGVAVQKDRNVYSGERTLLGVATMHKSNMVPIFADKKEDAKDIAQMRRN